MAVVALLSDIIGALDGTPPRLVDSARHRGTSEGACAVATKAASDNTNSTYRMLRVPSNARIAELMLVTAAWGTSGAADIGVFETLANGGAAVNATLFASALNVAAAIAAPQNVTNVGAPADWNKKLWERLGLSADPGKDYDIVVRANNIGGAQGAAFALQAFWQR